MNNRPTARIKQYLRVRNNRDRTQEQAPTKSTYKRLTITSYGLPRTVA
ncbi:MAG: hypothetical protein ICV85_02810 [Tolypothrix sp. T3-bin4]|nr:hypothetical protein [Tolypothrix sp. T3-bin4]